MESASPQEIHRQGDRDRIPQERELSLETFKITVSWRSPCPAVGVGSFVYGLQTEQNKFELWTMVMQFCQKNAVQTLAKLQSLVSFSFSFCMCIHINCINFSV